VVAHELDDLAAGGGGLRLQGAHERDEAAGVGTAVHEIAILDQDGVAAGPVVLIVDEPGQAEHRAGGVGVAVQVAHCDEAAGVAGCTGGRRTGGARRIGGRRSGGGRGELGGGPGRRGGPVAPGDQEREQETGRQVRAAHGSPAYRDWERAPLRQGTGAPTWRK